MKCQALDMENHICGREAEFSCHYHGDSELYGMHPTRPPWVRVFLCADHAKDMHEPKKLAKQSVRGL